MGNVKGSLPVGPEFALSLSVEIDGGMEDDMDDAGDSLVSEALLLDVSFPHMLAMIRRRYNIGTLTCCRTSSIMARTSAETIDDISFNKAS